MKENDCGGEAARTQLDRGCSSDDNSDLRALICLDALEKHCTKSKITPFADVFWIFSWYRFNKERAWEFLKLWQSQGIIEIVSGHGIRLRE